MLNALGSKQVLTSYQLNKDKGIITHKTFINFQRLPITKATIKHNATVTIER